MRQSEEIFEQTGIEIRQEKAPVWFIIVSLLILAWAAGYVFLYWGGLGPGIGY